MFVIWVQCDLIYKAGSKNYMENFMSSKSLTGWLLIAGPIITLLVAGISYDAIIGFGED